MAERPAAAVSSSPGIAPACLQILGAPLAQAPAAGVKQRICRGDAVPKELAPPAILVRCAQDGPATPASPIRGQQ